VLRILQPKQFKSAAIEWGVDNGNAAVHQLPAVSWTPMFNCGSMWFLCKSHPPILGCFSRWSSASCTSSPFGFLEIKCPYKHRSVSPAEACSVSGFCCSLWEDGKLALKPNHPYYAQVQGQMAIGGRKWCDFVVYTTKKYLCNVLISIISTGNYSCFQN
jgi:hypothetical protein